MLNINNICLNVIYFYKLVLSQYIYIHIDKIINHCDFNIYSITEFYGFMLLTSIKPTPNFYHLMNILLIYLVIHVLINTNTRILSRISFSFNANPSGLLIQKFINFICHFIFFKYKIY